MAYSANLLILIVKVRSLTIFGLSKVVFDNIHNLLISLTLTSLTKLSMVPLSCSPPFPFRGNPIMAIFHFPGRHFFSITPTSIFNRVYPANLLILIVKVRSLTIRLCQSSC